jgi:hypothetical protein
LSKLDQDTKIEKALRISYDGLDSEQKSIFLDIAHFFKGWRQDKATRILDCLYGRSVIFDKNLLIDKCLISTTADYFYRDKIEMHDLLQEMAFNIVRAESKFPGERSRLCHPPDVVQVLEENKVKATVINCRSCICSKVDVFESIVLLFVYSLFLFNRELKKLKAYLWTRPC